MRYSTQIKPISYDKANAAEILIELAETGKPMIITQDGEAKPILQDLTTYEETQEMLAMLKILAMGNQDIKAGRTVPALEFMKNLKAKASD